jgi:hypothetical protein
MNPPILVGVCGSHLDSVQRIGYLRAMLRSWAEQEHGIALYLSLSCEPGLEEEVSKEVERLQNAHPTLTMSRVETKRSQFQHYALITQRLLAEHTCNSDSVWVLFSDDDDIWHPRRTLEMYTNLKAMRHMRSLTSTSACVLPYYLDCPGTANVLTWKQAEDAIRRGTATIEYSPRRSTTELWLAACLLKHLADFIARSSDALLAHRYCDMCLSKYLFHSMGYGTARCSLSGDATWLYMHRGKNGLVKNTPKLASLNAMEVLASKSLRREDVFEWMGHYLKIAWADVQPPADIVQHCRSLVRDGELDILIYSPMLEAP